MNLPFFWCDADEGGASGRGEAGCDEAAEQIFTAQVSYRRSACPRVMYSSLFTASLIPPTPSIPREVPELVNSLSWVLDSPAKIVLFHYICQLLPDNAQVDFDRIAAAMLAGGQSRDQLKYGIEKCLQVRGYSKFLAAINHLPLATSDSNSFGMCPPPPPPFPNFYAKKFGHPMLPVLSLQMQFLQ